MIARLTGEIVDIQPAHIVLQVGGVGYLLAVTHGSAYTLGAQISLHTYLAVRETALDLYGFETKDEHNMFEELIKIPKIGPKTALQILSQADIETLKKAVRMNDATYLSKMSGIGKKSAEKIVAGLKNTLGEDVLIGIASYEHESDADVVDALLALGYSERDAREAIQHIPPDITTTAARIRHALKEVAQ